MKRKASERKSEKKQIIETINGDGRRGSAFITVSSRLAENGERRLLYLLAKQFVFALFRYSAWESGLPTSSHL